MVSISVQDVSMTFPMYAGVDEQGAADPGRGEDARLVYDRRGRIRGVRALRNITFDLSVGDKLAIVGRNGSGKTTLLQILSGILAPDAGRVVLSGKATNLININLGMQPEATGHENITLRGLATGRTRREIEAHREEIVAFAELGAFTNMPVETYSAGMRMRLSFAIATAFDSEILILDEWLSAGDTAFKARATQRMQDFVSRAGILILASHSRKLLLDNCNKGLWMDAGEIRAMGPVIDVLDAYESSIAEPTGT